jgi:hypothetical protein
VAQIEVLQAELADANESLDEKIDRLEHLGLGTVQLTQKLTEARTRIGELERELERYKKREERLVRCKCVWCGKRFDASKVIRGEGSRFVILLHGLWVTYSLTRATAALSNKTALTRHNRRRPSAQLSLQRMLNYPHSSFDGKTMFENFREEKPFCRIRPTSLMRRSSESGMVPTAKRPESMR